MRCADAGTSRDGRGAEPNVIVHLCTSLGCSVDPRDCSADAFVTRTSSATSSSAAMWIPVLLRTNWLGNSRRRRVMNQM